MLRKVLLFFIIFFLFFDSTVSVLAQSPALEHEERLEGEVVAVLEEKTIIENTSSRPYQKLEILVTSNGKKGDKIIVENGKIEQIGLKKYKVGDKMIITAIDDNGENQYFINDSIRRDQIYQLFIVFLVAVIVVGGLRGVLALVGMVITFAVIFLFILPQIISGKDPVLVSILASLFIIPITFILSHGVSRKTFSAMIGTVLGLIITGVFATIFVDAARLTGFSSEEASFLANMNSGSVNIRGLLLAGIILGALGVLDDITISQASVIQEIKKSSSNLSPFQLYKKAMVVGRDHISSMVNTLFLVYTGASLPLLLLFINSTVSFETVVNYEIIAEEIIRTLIASIGLIAAVPITTVIASLLIAKERKKIN